MLQPASRVWTTQVLICHLFYLPYEHGPRATAMLQSVAWLLEHLPPPINVELHSPLSPASSSDDDDDARYEWYDRASRFGRSYRDVAMAVDKLVNIPNRELLYDVYAYITDMRSTLALVNSYIKWLGTLRSFSRNKFYMLLITYCWLRDVVLITLL